MTYEEWLEESNINEIPEEHRQDFADATHAAWIAGRNAIEYGLLSLVLDLYDKDPCEYDHHDHCQAHSLHARPCPHETAKKLIDHIRSH